MGKPHGIVSMNILITIVLALGAAVGCYQGAFKQIANLVGVVAGIVLAAMFYKKFGDFLAVQCGSSPGIGHIAAFVIIVILVPIALGFLASLLTKAFSTLHLGCINRLSGAAIGVVCYGLLLSFAFNAYDFVVSRCGYACEELECREPLYYTVKHAAQPIIPDLLIVYDSTEVANGATPHNGVKGIVDQAMDKVVGDKVQSVFGTHGEEEEQE